jgi:hypothetical protein
LRNGVLTLLGEDGVPNSAIEVVSGDAERAHLTLIGCDAPRDRAATRGLPEDDEFNTDQHRRGWAHGQCHMAHGSAFSTIHEQSLCSHMESLPGYAPPPEDTIEEAYGLIRCIESQIMPDRSWRGFRQHHAGSRGILHSSSMVGLD